MLSATTSAGCSTTESKRERKINFNDDELRVILDLFKTNASILNGKFTPNITQKGKNRIWDSITVATAACVYCTRWDRPTKLKRNGRTWREPRSKLLLKWRTPRLQRAGRATVRPGYVDTVLDILGEETALVLGIDGKLVSRTRHSTGNIILYRSSRKPFFGNLSVCHHTSRWSVTAQHTLHVSQWCEQMHLPLRQRFLRQLRW